LAVFSIDLFQARFRVAQTSPFNPVFNDSAPGRTSPFAALRQPFFSSIFRLNRIAPELWTVDEDRRKAGEGVGDRAYNVIHFPSQEGDPVKNP
jgi:hypothetical protein